MKIGIATATLVAVLAGSVQSYDLLPGLSRIAQRMLEEGVHIHERVYPKGIQPPQSGAKPDPYRPGGYLPRLELKPGMTTADLSRYGWTHPLRTHKL